MTEMLMPLVILDNAVLLNVENKCIIDFTEKIDG